MTNFQFSIFNRFTLLFLLVMPVIVLSAGSADLKISADDTSYGVGDIVVARVLLSSTGQSANAVSGVLSFPADKLQVTSISKTGSVINLWVQDPTYSNTNGQVTFEGAILNPGYTGSSGQILTINFRARKIGLVGLLFSSGSVLANDGAGTSILRTLGRVSFTIESADGGETSIMEVSPPSPEDEEEAQGGETSKRPLEVSPPGKPVITSSTDPDQKRWYNNNYPKFAWTLPADVTDVSLVLDNKDNTIPSAKSQGLFSSYDYDAGVPDGVYYFHLRYKNNLGWGATGHFALHLDSQKPDRFDVNEIKLTDGSGKARFIFDASDNLSGLDRFEFQIDHNEAQSVSVDAMPRIFDTAKLRLGRHTLTARAIDRAGNIAERKLDFTVLPPIAGSWLMVLGNNLIVVLSVLIPAVVLLLVLLYILVFGSKKISTLKKRLRQEVDEAQNNLHQAFGVIKSDLQEQMDLLKQAKTKRKLTSVEAKLMRKLKTDLTQAEKFIKKDIEDIAKQVK